MTFLLEYKTPFIKGVLKVSLVYIERIEYHFEASDTEAAIREISYQIKVF